MPDNIRVMNKVKKMYKITKAENVGFISESFQVNCYFQTDDGLRFYISFNKHDGWQIDYTRDLSIRMRSYMQSIRNIKNQTETFNVINALINNIAFTMTYDGKCVF